MDKTHIFDIQGKVCIGPIHTKTDKDANPTEFYFEVIETNKYDATHITHYMSKNKLTLIKKRDSIIEDAKSKQEKLYQGSTYKGVILKPTIIERIVAKSNEIIK